MAIDIPIHLTDAEQALIVDLAARIAPGLSGQALINWVAGEAKKGLRESFFKLWLDQDIIEEQVTRQSRHQAAFTNFPEV